MDKRIVYALVVGILMYILVIYLAFTQRDLTIQQLLLILVTPFVMGLISRGIKKGLTLGFLVSFVMLTAEVIIIQPGAFSNPNVAAAIIIMTLPFVGISAVLGTAGGLVGKRLFKK